jgi:hypothetical protein
MLSRPKTVFTTPVQAWIGGSVGLSARRSRQWASDVHRLFRKASDKTPRQTAKAAA